MLTLIQLEGIPEIGPGDDLAGLLEGAIERGEVQPADGDILAVCHKVVSKAEGRLVALDRMRPTKIARAWALANKLDPREIQAALAEARRMVRLQGAVMITETRQGFVCAHSGVDRSNTPTDMVCLLPEYPDRSARDLADRLSAATGAQIGVVITDTWGRPFRLGAVNVAIGVAGLPALLDYRGQKDPTGRALQSSTTALADEVAAASGLLMGKLRRVPAVLIQGLPSDPAGEPGTGASLLRSRAEDIFR